MDMKVTIRETNPVEFTYWIKDVESIEEAKRAALQCYRTHIQEDNCYLGRTIPCKPKIEFGVVELINHS